MLARECAKNIGVSARKACNLAEVEQLGQLKTNSKRIFIVQTILHVKIFYIAPGPKKSIKWPNSYFLCAK